MRSKHLLFTGLFTLIYGIFNTPLADANPIFNINLANGESNFPSSVSLYGQIQTRVFDVANTSGATMPNMVYQVPTGFSIDTTNSTCGTNLNNNATCQLIVQFNPNQLGSFIGQLKVCGGNGIWCSVYPTQLSITVNQTEIISSNCNDIAYRPFAELDCNGSQTYANNFQSFLTQVLSSQPTHSEFYYIQHQPSESETTTPCLESRQNGVGLDSQIKGGGIPLCNLMEYSSSNSNQLSSKKTAALSKLFPPYLTRLLGTSYPITSSTMPLDDLNTLLTEFNTTAMDGLVRDLGFTGFETFLSEYYQQQLSKTYTNCGTSETCPSIFYLPYQLTSGQSVLETWPPNGISYWGIGGGAGSGAGYQIEAFKSGSSTHYTLFSGGGGGGGGNTTPENVSLADAITLLDTGSGGGGGSQFASCYIKNSDNLNGLGLGAGTGSGLSAEEETNISYQTPPAVDYSFYPPTTHPSWTDNEILTNYGSNLTYLFATLLPQLYNEGYTITITGGGGGGANMEFFNSSGTPFQPVPLDINYGFQFCYAFNKNNQYTANDCLASPTVTANTNTVNAIVYNNIGNLFKQGMNLAILPQNCNGYKNSICTCEFQYAYVVSELDTLLIANGFSSDDVPTWLINPHCNDSQLAILARAHEMDATQQISIHEYVKNLQRFFTAKLNSTCSPPWLLFSRQRA